MEEEADICRQRASEEDGEEFDGDDGGVGARPAGVSEGVFLPEERGGVGAVGGSVVPVFVAEPGWGVAGNG